MPEINWRQFLDMRLGDDSGSDLNGINNPAKFAVEGFPAGLISQKPAAIQANRPLIGLSPSLTWLSPSLI